MNYIPENMVGAYKGTSQRTLFLTLFPCQLISQMKALQLFGVIFLSFSWTGHKGKSCLLRVNKKCLSRNEEQKRWVRLWMELSYGEQMENIIAIPPKPTKC